MIEIQVPKLDDPMKALTLLALLSYFLFAFATSAKLRGNAPNPPPDVNERPIIGILTLPNTVKGQNGTSFFPASYVKWIEQAGGRVVPIFYNSPESKVKDLVSKINGVLFTGGGTYFYNQDGTLTPYAKTGKVIFDLVHEAHRKGEWFPLWGTCLGFELITVLAANTGKVLTGGFDSDNATWPFYPTADASKSLMFKSMPDDVYSIITTEDVTMNSHIYGIRPDNFKAYPSLVNNYYILGQDKCRKGNPFVSAIESKTMPIFGAQFHPEKPSVRFRVYPMQYFLLIGCLTFIAFRFYSSSGAVINKLITPPTPFMLITGSLPFSLIKPARIPADFPL